MIWHIFKKDVRLLWPLIALVAAAQCMTAAMWLSLGHFGEPNSLVRILQNIILLTWIGIAVLIAMAVHQDSVPGDRQDWLVRPVCRRDLILAKLLFVLIAVHGPMFLMDLTQCLAKGFNFWDSVSAVLSRDVALLIDLSLPVLAVASMTSTLIEFIGGVLVIGLIEIAFFAGIPELFFGGFIPPVVSSGMGWIEPAFTSAVALAAVVAVVPLQYFRRSTTLARSIALSAALLAPIFMFIPWTPAFSFQQWFSANPAAAKAIEVAFDPDLGKLFIEPGGRSRANSVWLPFRVSGLAPESIVISDSANVRIIGRDGAILYQGRTTGDPQTTGDPGYGPFHIEDFPVRTAAAGGDVRTHQLVTLPGKVYKRIRSQLVRMELDYSLTLFHIEAADTIAAQKGDKRIANLGWCKTKIDDNGDSVDIGCIKTGSAPTCMTVVLENTVSGQRNPASNACRPDYTPYTAHISQSPISHFGPRLSFRDSQGLAKYPVDSTQLANARVSVKSYKPVAHFTRHLTIPNIRLSDWEAETPEIATNTAPK